MLRSIRWLTACVADVVEPATVLVLEGESMWNLDTKHLGVLGGLDFPPECLPDACWRNPISQWFVTWARCSGWTNQTSAGAKTSRRTVTIEACTVHRTSSSTDAAPIRACTDPVCAMDRWLVPCLLVLRKGEGNPRHEPTRVVHGAPFPPCHGAVRSDESRRSSTSSDDADAVESIKAEISIISSALNQRPHFPLSSEVRPVSHGR